MFNKKKTECRVCGYRFTPERENIYTAEEPRSMADMLTKPPTRFSAVDCPICGCQIALAIRVPRVDISDNAERHDADRAQHSRFTVSGRGQRRSCLPELRERRISAQRRRKRKRFLRAMRTGYQVGVRR